MFVLLPTFDQATAGFITTYMMTCSIPWLCGEILNPVNRLPDNTKRYSFTILLFLANFGIFIGYVVVASESSDSNSQDLMIAMVIVIPLVLSVGFMENLSGIYFEILQKRNLVMILVSCSKFMTIVLTFIMIYGAFGGLRTLLHTGPSTTNIALLERDITLFNSLPFGGNCSYEHPIVIAVISIITSYVCYKFSYYACRTALQWQSFSIPLVLSTICVPIFVGFFFEPDTFYSKVQNCSIISNDWDFHIEQGNTANQRLLIAFIIITILCFLLMTPHIWREGVKIELVEKYVHTVFVN